MYVYDNRQNKLCETHVNFDRTFSCQLKELLPAGTNVYIIQSADGYYPSDPTVATVSQTFNEPTPPIVIVPPSKMKPGAARRRSMRMVHSASRLNKSCLKGSASASFNYKAGR